MIASASRIAGLAMAGAVVASCLSTGASTNDPLAVLRATARNMGKISSGELHLRLSTAAKDAEESGFELAGPFSLTSPGDIPVAELEHTRFDGDRRATATFVSTGRSAYVVRDGRTTRLAPDQVAELRPFVRGAGGEASGIDDLRLDRWITGRPTIEGGGRIGGVATDKVTARLNAAEVLNGVVQVARALGAGQAAQLSPVEGAEASRLRRAVRTARMEVWSGQEDRILRKVLIHIEFALRDEELARRLAEYSGATIDLEATIERLNERIEVEAPDEG